MLKKTLLAAALIAGTFATPASAELFSLGSSKGWEFTANLDTGICMAGTRYDNGDGIILVRNAEGFAMSFKSSSAKRLNIGESYHIDVSSSGGRKNGRMWGIAVGHDQIVIRGLTVQTVYNIAKERNLKIKDFGTYSMYGSYNAIKLLAECCTAVK